MFYYIKQLSMFSLSVHGDEILINIDHNGFHISLEPESIEAVEKINLDSNYGCFNSKPTNGEFYISWTPTHIRICVAKYGDGNGGSIILTIPSSSDLIKELCDVLLNLKKLQEVRKNDW